MPGRRRQAEDREVVAANTSRLKGDFEITASDEILKADQPTEGYGVGVSMFVAIEPGGLDGRR